MRQLLLCALLAAVGPVQAQSRAQDAAPAVASEVVIVLRNAPLERAAEVFGRATRTNIKLHRLARGLVSVRVEGTLPAEAVLDALRDALASVGMVLEDTSPEGFLITPREIVQARLLLSAQPPAAPLEPVRIIAQAHILSAREAADALARAGFNLVVRVAEDRAGAIVLEGDPREVEIGQQLLAAIDVETDRRSAVEFVRPRFVDPTGMAAELAQLLESAQITNVRVTPLPNSGGLAIISDGLIARETVKAWVTELDKEPEAGSLSFFKPQHASAVALAESVSKALANGPVGATGAGRGGQASISADEATNALIIRATPGALTEIEALLHRLDQPPVQVMIEATIIEVTLNNELRFGLDWKINPSAKDNFSLSRVASGAVASAFPGFSYSYINQDVNVAVNALSAKTDVQVISTPRIIAMENETASLQVGDEVPILRQTAQSVENPNSPIVNQIEYRETGVLLKVKPRVNGNGQVVLEVAQEFSEVARTTESGIDSPTIQQRRLESTLTVQDGGTVAVGGLIRGSRTKGRTGVPWLSAIPVLGAAFRTDEREQQRTELVVFLTPRVLRNANDIETANAAAVEGAHAIQERKLLPGGAGPKSAPKATPEAAP